MLSADQVVALARAEGLGHVADDLVQSVRPGWRLVPSGDAARIGTSKVGGSPDLAEGEPWPSSPRGIPMGFVAQIDCSAIPPLAPEWRDRVRPWEHGDGLIRLFANVLEDYEVGAARALVCDPRAPLTRQPAPPAEPGDGEQLYGLPETAVRLEPFLTAPEMHPVLRPDLDRFDKLAEGYLQWAYRLRIDGAANDDSTAVDPWEVHHLLGEGTSVQDDVRHVGSMLHEDAGAWEYERHGPADPALAHADAWQILLGLHMDDRLRLEIFDGGALHILAPVTDLAAGRLDRLVFATSSG